MSTPHDAASASPAGTGEFSRSGARWRVAAVLLGVALIGAAVVIIHEYGRRRAIERTSATAKAGADFVATMFDASLPGAVALANTPLSTLVDRASRRLEHAPPADPLAAAAAALALARIELAIDRKKEAQQRVNAAGAALDALGAPALRLRFDAALLSLEIRAARVPDADVEQGARALAAEARRQLGRGDPLQYDAANLLGRILLAQKRFTDAAAEFERVDAAASARRDQRADALDGLAHAQAGIGNLSLAVATQQRRSTLLESEYAANDPRTLAAVGDLALALQQDREFDAALKHYDRAYAGLAELLGPEHPHALANLLGRARVLWLAARPAEAEMAARQLLDLIDRDDPVNTNMIIAAGDLLAHALLDQQRHADAIPVQRELIERMLAAKQKVAFGERAMLADLLIENGDAAGAEIEYQLALDAAFDELGPDDVNIQILANSYGDALRRLGHFDRAEPMLLKTEAALRAALDPAHPLLRKARQRLADLYDAMGAPDRAAPWRAPSD
jgi:hypothetical protein